MLMCCLRCNTVWEDVATDRCYAAEAGSPAGPHGGPSGQRDRVAPGARSGLCRAGAPRPIIGRWGQAPRGTGEVTWGRRAMRRGQSGSVWSGVWCGAERFSVHVWSVEKETIYSGMKSSGVR